MRSILNDRILWFDGSSTFSADDLLDIIQKYPSVNTQPVVYVDKLTKELKSPTNRKRYKIKEKSDPVSVGEWNIPEWYKRIDIRRHIANIAANDISIRKSGIRLARLRDELEEYEKRNMFGLLQTMIYVIDEFKKHNVVWGIGRGSSVASYVLYLLEVHDVDSVEHGLDYKEFLK